MSRSSAWATTANPAVRPEIINHFTPYLTISRSDAGWKEPDGSGLALRQIDSRQDRGHVSTYAGDRLDQIVRKHGF